MQLSRTQLYMVLVSVYAIYVNVLIGPYIIGNKPSQVMSYLITYHFFYVICLICNGYKFCMIKRGVEFRHLTDNILETGC